MIQTHGLTHISLAVRDVPRAVAFYRQLFGVVVLVERDGMAQVRTPGTHEVIAFERDEERAGAPGGVRHFGFRLRDREALDAAVVEAEDAGGRVLKRGEFAPGCPYAYVADPDGYMLELWYE